jgi:predicted kinase
MSRSSKLILTLGLPGSGKSTWAREYVQKSNGTAVNLCKDDLRLMFSETENREQKVLELRNLLTEKYLAEGLDVIWSDTNLNPIHHQTAEEIAKKYNSKLEFQDFRQVDIDTCIQRDLNRPHSVGEKVIRNMYQQWLEPKTKPAKQDPTLPKVILCDIDGTVAKMHNRSPYDWSKVDQDHPNTPVIHTVQIFHQAGYKIIFLSGRDGNPDCREKTLNWIAKHIGFAKSSITLFMRQANDMREDAVVKREIYEAEILGKYFVELVLDDRDQVVKLWRKDLGLTCLQVDYGNF